MLQPSPALNEIRWLSDAHSLPVNALPLSAELSGRVFSGSMPRVSAWFARGWRCGGVPACVDYLRIASEIIVNIGSSITYNEGPTDGRTLCVHSFTPDTSSTFKGVRNEGVSTVL